MVPIGTIAIIKIKMPFIAQNGRVTVSIGIFNSVTAGMTAMRTFPTLDQIGATGNIGL